MNLCEALKEYLGKLGCSHETDQDGDLVFVLDALTFLVILEEDDPGYIRLTLPAVWRIRDESETGDALLAAMKVNKTVKLAKAFLLDDLESVWVSAEGYVDTAELLEPRFQRLIQCVQRAREVFIAEMMT